MQKLSHLYKHKVNESSKKITACYTQKISI